MRTRTAYLINEDLTGIEKKITCELIGELSDHTGVWQEVNADYNEPQYYLKKIDRKYYFFYL